MWVGVFCFEQISKFWNVQKEARQTHKMEWDKPSMSQGNYIIL